ncbi:MAG: hypothetical protein NT154_32380 [Verrucomicrobia bacterium]|nr:hypothetical protein [Verrucomicrobiota bacterium]
MKTTNALLRVLDISLAPASRISASSIMPLLLLLCTLPAGVQAHFFCTTDNGTTTITGYTGPGGATPGCSNTVCPRTARGITPTPMATA